MQIAANHTLEVGPGPARPCTSGHASRTGMPGPWAFPRKRPGAWRAGYGLPHRRQSLASHYRRRWTSATELPRPGRMKRSTFGWIRPGQLLISFRGSRERTHDE